MPTHCHLNNALQFQIDTTYCVPVSIDVTLMLQQPAPCFLELGQMRCVVKCQILFQAAPVQDSAQGRLGQHVCSQLRGGGGQVSQTTRSESSIEVCTVLVCLHPCVMYCTNSYRRRVRSLLQRCVPSSFVFILVSCTVQTVIDDAFEVFYRGVYRPRLSSSLCHVLYKQLQTTRSKSSIEVCTVLVCLLSLCHVLYKQLQTTRSESSIEVCTVLVCLHPCVMYCTNSYRRRVRSLLQRCVPSSFVSILVSCTVQTVIDDAFEVFYRGVYRPRLSSSLCHVLYKQLQTTRSESSIEVCTVLVCLYPCVMYCTNSYRRRIRSLLQRCVPSSFVFILVSCTVQTVIDDAFEVFYRGVYRPRLSLSLCHVLYKQLQTTRSKSSIEVCTVLVCLHPCVMYCTNSYRRRVRSLLQRCVPSSFVSILVSCTVQTVIDDAFEVFYRGVYRPRLSSSLCHVLYKQLQTTRSESSIEVCTVLVCLHPCVMYCTNSYRRRVQSLLQRCVPSSFVSILVSCTVQTVIDDAFESLLQRCVPSSFVFILVSCTVQTVIDDAFEVFYRGVYRPRLSSSLCHVLYKQLQTTRSKSSIEVCTVLVCLYPCVMYCTNSYRRRIRSLLQRCVPSSFVSILVSCTVQTVIDDAFEVFYRGVYRPRLSSSLCHVLYKQLQTTRSKSSIEVCTVLVCLYPCVMYCTNSYRRRVRSLLQRCVPSSFVFILVSCTVQTVIDDAFEVFYRGVYCPRLSLSLCHVLYKQLQTTRSKSSIEVCTVLVCLHPCVMYCTNSYRRRIRSLLQRCVPSFVCLYPCVMYCTNSYRRRVRSLLQRCVPSSFVFILVSSTVQTVIDDAFEVFYRGVYRPRLSSSLCHVLYKQLQTTRSKSSIEVCTVLVCLHPCSKYWTNRDASFVRSPIKIDGQTRERERQSISCG